MHQRGEAAETDILIVTHNPNLAVVCDAEQVICAELDKKDNFRMKYLVRCNRESENQ